MLEFISQGLRIPNIKTQNNNGDSGNGTKVTHGIVHENQNHFIHPMLRARESLFIGGDQESYVMIMLSFMQYCDSISL
jgi:hypothetical protein